MRNSLQVVAEQQILVESLAMGIDKIARETGVDLSDVKRDANNRVDRLRRQARFERFADEANPANPVPEPAAQAPAFTTEQYRSPSATAPVTGEGGSVATNGVTPASVVDVTSPGGVIGAPLDLNEQDVTAPVTGTQELSGANKVEHDISSGVDNPPVDAPMFPLEGPFAEAPKVTAGSEARMFASIRLARLRIEAGIVPPQDDMVLGNAIAVSRVSDQAIQHEISTLSAVTKASGARGAVVASRSVVPRSADGNERAIPSLVSLASGDSVSGSMSVSEDELGEF